MPTSTRKLDLGLPLRQTLFAALVSCALIVVGLSLPTPLTAYTNPGNEGFVAGNIISDASFYNSNSMTTQQVGDFINAKGASCVNNTAAGVPCLKNYRQDTPAVAATGWCSALTAMSGSSAASIISRVTKACGTSPQVMLAMIQKESSLVTASGSDLTTRRYATATGAGCPDFAACNSSLANFFNQVYKTSSQFAHYRANPSLLNYQPYTQVSMLYNPEQTCGKASFYLANVATASLYTYTPYTPNRAALDAGSGSGDLCSAYGNRNFYRLMKSWFPGSVYNSGTSSYPTPASTVLPQLTATYAEWSMLGSSALGSTSGPMLCSSTYCSKPFANGRIYSTGADAHAVLKPAYDVYVAAGGATSSVGLPIADSTCGLTAGGCKQRFANGWIVWTPTTGTRLVRGAISTSWNAKGAEAGPLGYPKGDEVCASSTSCYQDFQGGRLTSAQTTDPAVDLDAGLYTSLAPARLLDTRLSGGPVAGGATTTLRVLGRGGVPSSGVSSVVLNVTVTETKAKGYLTAYPSGTGRPNSSTLNFAAGQTVANQVMVRVGSDGNVALTNAASASVQVVVDVVGAFGVGQTGVPGAFVGLSPARILDTRINKGAAGPVAPNGSVTVNLAGQGGFPTSPMAAVALNVTVTDTKAPGFVTAYPADQAVPTASNLNFVGGQTRANLVVVPVNADGKISIKVTSSASSSLIADAVGYFLPGTSTQPGAFVPLTSTRILDTRLSLGGTGPVPPNKTITARLGGRVGFPATGVSAVVMNLTATTPTAAGFVTVFPAGQAEPTASHVNYASGETVANLALVRVSPTGDVGIVSHSTGTVQLIGDVAGYFRS